MCVSGWVRKLCASSISGGCTSASKELRAFQATETQRQAHKRQRTALHFQATETSASARVKTLYLKQERQARKGKQGTLCLPGNRDAHERKRKALSFRQQRRSQAPENSWRFFKATKPSTVCVCVCVCLCVFRREAEKGHE
jgi:hypothetical protein